MGSCKEKQQTHKEKTRGNLKSKQLQKKGQKYQMNEFLERQKYQKQLLNAFVVQYSSTQRRSSQLEILECGVFLS